jgi:hypothetical protein
MCRIISYSVTTKASTCQLALKSGERVFVEVVHTAWPKVQITRVLLGAIPGPVVWRYTKDDVGDAALYRENIKQMFPITADSPETIDVIIGMLKRCESAKQAKERLVQRAQSVSSNSGLAAVA